MSGQLGELIEKLQTSPLWRKHKRSGFFLQKKRNLVAQTRSLAQDGLGCDISLAAQREDAFSKRKG